MDIFLIALIFILLLFGVIIYFSGVIVLINAILEVKEEKYLYNNKKENEKNDSNKN